MVNRPSHPTARVATLPTPLCDQGRPPAAGGVRARNSPGICTVTAVWHAGPMPGIAIPQAADAATAGSLPSRGRLSTLADSPNARHVLGVIALALLYRGVAQIGYQLQFAGPVAAIVWLPVGIGVAFLYLGGLRFWPGVLVGDLLANDYAALPLGSALGQTAGNVLEVVVMTMLLRRLVPSGDPLGSIRGVMRMLVAIGAGAAVSASVGPLSLLLGGVIDVAEIPDVWRTWWLGDATGALILLPLALAWARPRSGSWLRRHGIEALLLLTAMTVLSELALRASEQLTYLVFPPLVWAALRLGRRGATVAVAVAAGFAVWETTRRMGPFAYQSITYSILGTQLYIAVSSISTLCLTAAVSERKGIAERLAASRARLVEAADTERRRIEHNLHDGAQQRLTALVVQLRIAAERAREEPGRAAGALASAEAELSLAIDELRELAHGIHPPVLTRLGLEGALAAMAARSAIPIRLLDMPASRLDPIAEATAYFVASEAVTNARKHADATEITIRAVAARGILRVRIVDDGRGGADESAGVGLQGLRDRVEAVGGRFVVMSTHGHGTTVLAAMPVAPPVRG
jgi:signal transduction histidine kinase